MVIIHIKEDQKEKAQQLYNFNILNNSFTKGKGNYSGALGEVILYEYMNISLSNQTHNYNYDIIINNEKYDIKTKRCKSIPKENYTCSVALTSLHQNCDNYIFLRVREDIDEAYILGYITKKDFINKGFFLKKGDLDEYGFEIKNDCINVLISDLTDIQFLYNNNKIDENFICKNYNYHIDNNIIYFFPSLNIKCLFRMIDKRLNVYINNKFIYDGYEISITNFLKIINNE